LIEVSCELGVDKGALCSVTEARGALSTAEQRLAHLLLGKGFTHHFVLLNIRQSMMSMANVNLKIDL